MKNAICWLVGLSVGPFWTGFWLCIGWDTARRLRLVELVQPWLQGVLGR